MIKAGAEAYKIRSHARQFIIGVYLNSFTFLMIELIDFNVSFSIRVVRNAQTLNVHENGCYDYSSNPFDDAVASRL